MTSHVTVSLGWTLVHALWQTTVLALLYAVWRHRTPAGSARRYRVAFAALVIGAMAAAATFAGLMSARLPVPAQAVVVAPSGGSGAIFEGLRVPGSGTAAPPAPHAFPLPRLRLSDILTVLSWAWLAGSLAFAVRIGGGLWVAWRIRGRARVSTSDAVARAFTRVAPHLPTPPVVLLESKEITSPATLGWWRPAILIPSALAQHGSADVLEPLLAHELAHVRSGDYANNLAQSAIDALLFLCPGARWLSSDVRRLREYRCDDAAAALMAGPDVYVRALAGIAETERRFLPLPVPGAAGPRLADRARRLLEGEPMIRLSPFRLLAFATSIIVLITAGIRLAPSSWAAAAEKAPATTAAAPPPSSAPSAATDPSIARELETIPISGSTCTTDCVVRVEEVRRGTDSLMDTIRLRNQTTQTITSVVITGFLELQQDGNTRRLAPMGMRRSDPIPVQLKPGASGDVRVQMWKVNDQQTPLMSAEKMVSNLKGAWHRNHGAIPVPPVTAHVEVTEATKADGTKWGVVIQTEPMSPEADRLAPKDCVTPYGHKVKHGSGFPTLGQQGPPVQCLGGRWFQHGQATKAAGPGESDLLNIPISGSTCTTNCVVRVEEVHRGADSLYETVRLRNQSDQTVTSVVLAGMIETNWDEAPPKPNLIEGPSAISHSDPIPLQLAPGAAADVKVRIWKMKDEKNPPISLEGTVPHFQNVWKSESRANADAQPPQMTSRVEVVKVTHADGKVWGIRLQGEPEPAPEERGSPRECVTPNGHHVKHGSGISTLTDANELGVGPPTQCRFGHWVKVSPMGLMPALPQ